MPKPDFKRFQEDLRHSGVASRHVTRSLMELNDHFDDLVTDALADGADLDTAERRACRSLGDLQSIALDISSRPELSCWAFRYPRLAILGYPLMCAAVMPAYPVIAGIAHAPVVARWGASLLLGGAITAALMLFMQLSITLT